jgi:hypothetical protein
MIDNVTAAIKPSTHPNVQLVMWGMAQDLDNRLNAEEKTFGKMQENSEEK